MCLHRRARSESTQLEEQCTCSETPMTAPLLRLQKEWPRLCLRWTEFETSFKVQLAARKLALGGRAARATAYARRQNERQSNLIRRVAKSNCRDGVPSTRGGRHAEGDPHRGEERGADSYGAAAPVERARGSSGERGRHRRCTRAGGRRPAAKETGLRGQQDRGSAPGPGGDSRARRPDWRNRGRSQRERPPGREAPRPDRGDRGYL